VILRSLLWVIGVLCALLPVATGSAAGQTPTIEQSLSMNMVGSPHLSPDGRYVVYQERTTDWEQNAFVTQLRIAVTATGARYQLTSGKKSSVAPAWSPDSRRLAFLSDRDEKMQLYLIAPTGGEAFKLTNVETGINDYRWSPDGKQIAFTMSDPESKAEKDEKEKYGASEVIQQRYTMTHLWLLDVPDDNPARPVTPKRLTEGQQFTVNDFSWSPDSQRLAFAAAKNPDIDSEDTADIYVLNVQDKSVKKIVDTKGPDSNPNWSPDGKEIAYVTANGTDDFYYMNSYLAIVSANGGVPTVFTGVFDENPGLLVWTKDGVYFSAQQKTYAHLFRLNPKTKTVERISTPTEIVTNNFTFNRDGTRVAFTIADAKSAFDVAISPVNGFAPRRLTDMTEQFLKYKIATREVISWRSSDGTPIEGILYKPANFQKRRKYPLICAIHGGPADADTAYVGSSAAYPIEQLVAKGALVLKVNYRGSGGYGERFRALNVRNLGLGDYEDVISGVDSLIAQGMVDREKVGAMGFSQGGYICAFIATYCDRFKAVSVGAGISDWTTYYVNSAIHPFTRQYLKATPWDDPEIYRKTSPISYIKNAKTPTLIQHGDNDRIVPIANAFELYQGLKDRGVPVKMVVYRGFGHGIYKPKEQRTYSQHNYDWFCQWIWGEKP
jgi:dipeptidyl aminopeptidase/acylaminoacyl peptidase